MATIQTRNGSHRILFQYAGRQLTFTIGKVTDTEADQWKARTEQLLMRLDQGLMEIPPGVSVPDFLKHDGKPPVDPALTRAKLTTFAQLRDAYLETFRGGAVKASTLDTYKKQLLRLEETLGKNFVLSGLSAATLQRHIARRQTAVTPTTILKELQTLRTVWNWGARNGLVGGTFPAMKGLALRKSADKLPFMSWGEIERRIKGGADPEPLWECLYLDTQQLAAFLDFVKAEKPDHWIYPMLAMAAYTGARRSEMVRARVEDVDLGGGTILIREKKRAHGRTTTRRVPMTAALADILATQMKKQEGKPYLFGDGHEELTDSQTSGAFDRLVAGSKWKDMRGYHVCRHSFISACASRGIDQRLVDAWAGHCTETQRVRYRHPYPSIQAAALTSVFG